MPTSTRVESVGLLCGHLSAPRPVGCGGGGLVLVIGHACCCQSVPQGVRPEDRREGLRATSSRADWMHQRPSSERAIREANRQLDRARVDLLELGRDADVLHTPASRIRRLPRDGIAAAPGSRRLV